MIPPESPDARMVLTVAPTSTAIPIQKVRVAPRRACSPSSDPGTGGAPNAVGCGNAVGAGDASPGTVAPVAGAAGHVPAGAVVASGSSGSHSCHPSGTGGSVARSGCQPGGGVHPAGGCGQDGGGWKRMVTSGGGLGLGPGLGAP